MAGRGATPLALSAGCRLAWLRLAIERKLDPTGSGSPYEIINPNDPATRSRGRQLADHAHATRTIHLRICTNGASHQRRYSHVLGFTLTYNDFDYTGMVIRLEQTYSTKEGLNKRVLKAQ